MKVNSVLIIIDFNSQAHQTITIALKEVSRRRKITQACPCQGQKGTNAQVRRRKEKKHSFKWNWKGKNGTKKTGQPKGCWNYTVGTWRCQGNEQDGCLC